MGVHAAETADQTVTATDVDGDPLTFSALPGPSFLTVTTTDPGAGIATGNIHLAPSVQDVGRFPATLSVYDGVNYRFASFSISVYPTLDTVGSLTVNEGTVVDQPLIAHDPGHLVFFTVAGGPPFVTVSRTNDSTASLHIAPGFEDSGNYGGTITASDGTARYSVPLRLLINNVPRQPILNQPSDMHAAVSTTSEQGLSATDPDGRLLSFYKAAGPPYMTVGTLASFPALGYVRLSAPALADTGEVTAMAGVNDGILSDEASFRIRVDLENASPILSPAPDIDMLEGASFLGTLVGTDPDGHRLTFSATQVPRFMTFTPQAQPFGNDTIWAYFALDPGFDDAGAYSVIIRLSDGLASVVDTLRVTVRDAKNPETSLRLGVSGGPIRKYSAADGAFRMTQSKSGDRVSFDFADTLGSGAHWNFSFTVPGGVHEGDYLSGFSAAGSDTTALGLVPCPGTSTFFEIRQITPRLGGPITAFRATFETTCADGTRFAGDMRYQVPGFPLILVAPGWIPAATRQLLRFDVTATDSANAAITISAAGLPSGATFSDSGNGRGTFAWSPPRLAAGNYTIGFTASSANGEETAFTTIHVVSTDRAPRAFAGGPYTGKAGVPIQFTSDGSVDPDGDSLSSYHWTFGDGGTANGPYPLHAYRLPGPYPVGLLVSDGLLAGGDNTLATVYWPDSAAAFNAAQAVAGPHSVQLQAGGGHFCVGIEILDAPASVIEIDPSTVRMAVKGLGAIDAIPADPRLTFGDANGNGIPDMTACFGSEGLRPLFSKVNGRIHALATIEFTLENGHVFRAPLAVDVVGPDRALSPLLAPNPLRPSGVFSFVTRIEGRARLQLFDSHGRRVRTLLDISSLPTGYHDLPIDTHDQEGRALPSGVYYYRLETVEGTHSGRLAVFR